MTPRDFPVLLRRHTATTAGAIILGLVALVFAWAADQASSLFEVLVERAPYAPLVVTPVGLAVIVTLTRRIAPQARGSGIPQVSAGAEDPKRAIAAGLISMKAAIFRLVATVTALLIGTSVGRERPTVQISAAIMAFVHCTLKIELSAAVVIAGGAAGVSAARRRHVASPKQVTATKSSRRSRGTRLTRKCPTTLLRLTRSASPTSA